MIVGLLTLLSCAWTGPRDGQLLEEVELSCGPAVECHRIRYGSDGLSVVGFLIKPVGKGPWPVLIYNRGGAGENGVIFGRRLLDLEHLARCGYVVLASQYRGNDGGEGRDTFGDVADVVNVAKVAEALPYADESKMVMVGYSRGGMMTFLAIQADMPLAAAAVVGAPTDQFRTRDERPKMAKHLEGFIGGPQDDPAYTAAWAERSALRWPEELDVPLLLLHGGLDDRVHVGHAVDLAARLEALGKPHRLEVFPGGDHYLTTHRQERDQLIQRWFEDALRTR